MALPDTLHIHFDPTDNGHNQVDDIDAITERVAFFGPTASWLLYLTATAANRHGTNSYKTVALATSLGVLTHTLNNAIARLVMFGVAYWASTDTVVIVSPLPPIPDMRRARHAGKVATR